MKTNTITSEPKDLIRDHTVVPRNEWIALRKELLDKEKVLTQLRDELAGERRALPWMKIEKDYLFDAPEGKVTLADLFDGRSQLFIKHFMISSKRPNGRLNWRTYPATASFSRTTPVRSFIPTRLSAAAVRSSSGFTGISRQRRKVAMRMGLTTPSWIGLDRGIYTVRAARSKPTAVTTNRTAAAQLTQRPLDNGYENISLRQNMQAGVYRAGGKRQVPTASFEVGPAVSRCRQMDSSGRAAGVHAKVPHLSGGLRGGCDWTRAFIHKRDLPANGASAPVHRLVVLPRGKTNATLHRHAP
jgi:hypothetical protein